MGLVQFIAGHLRRSPSASPSSNDPVEAAHLELGRLGENLAAKYLSAHGYKVLHRNFRAPRGGEVDLVCRDKKSARLVFVEVKTRSSERYGRPISAVDRSKQFLISRGAFAWLRMLDNPEVPFRFDVVEVVMNEPFPTITIVEDAFHLPSPYRY